MLTQLFHAITNALYMGLASQGLELAVDASVELSVLTSPEEWAALESDWEALAARQTHGSPFMSWPWMRTWWRIYGDLSMLLRILVCRQGDTVIGIAPFIIVDQAQWPLRPSQMRVMRLLGTGEADSDSVVTEYADLLIEPGHEQAVTQLCAAWLCVDAGRSWDVLTCDYLLQESNIQRWLLPALRSRHRAERSRSAGLRYRARMLETWDAYLRSIGSNIRYKLTVGRRRMERVGQFTVERVTAADEMAGALRRLAVLHRQRWEGKGYTGSFDSDKFRSFHESLAAELAGRQGASVTLVSLDGRDMAAVYTLHDAHTSYSYQTGFDSNRAANYSPGTIVVGIDMQHAIAAGRSYYDFMCSSPGSYKERYGCETDEAWHTYTFNRTARGFLSLCLWTLARTVNQLRRRRGSANGAAEAPEAAVEPG